MKKRADIREEVDDVLDSIDDSLLLRSIDERTDETDLRGLDTLSVSPLDSLPT